MIYDKGAVVMIIMILMAIDAFFVICVFVRALLHLSILKSSLLLSI